MITSFNKVNNLENIFMALRPTHSFPQGVGSSRSEDIDVFRLVSVSESIV